MKGVMLGSSRSFIINELPPKGSFGKSITAGIDKSEYPPVPLRVGSGFHDEEVPGQEPRNRLVLKKVQSWISNHDDTHIVFGAIAGNCDVAREGEYVIGVINRRDGTDRVDIEINIYQEKPDAPFPLFR